MPNKRMNVIDKESKKLSFYKLRYYSIRAELFTIDSKKTDMNILTAARTFVNANLSIDFSKLPEGKTPPIKTNLSVGDLALLFRMLFELRPVSF
jgi:hypothetical protein